MNKRQSQIKDILDRITPINTSADELIAKLENQEGFTRHSSPVLHRRRINEDGIEDFVLIEDVYPTVLSNKPNTFVFGGRYNGDVTLARDLEHYEKIRYYTEGRGIRGISRAFVNTCSHPVGWLASMVGGIMLTAGIASIAGFGLGIYSMMAGEPEGQSVLGATNEFITQNSRYIMPALGAVSLAIGTTLVRLSHGTNKTTRKAVEQLSDEIENYRFGEEIFSQK